MTIPNLAEIKEKVNLEGFAVVDSFYTDDEIDQLASIIEKTDSSASTFRKSADVFAIRQFFKSVPAAIPHIFNNKLRKFVSDIMGADYFAVKSIYFDKPGNSNWLVAYHQDLTISVKRRVDIPGFGPWTTKQDQFGVQPPLNILEQNFTVRIHLDDTTKENGALKVIPGSHLKGIHPPQPGYINEEVTCEVGKGGIMLMRPLLLHSSGRTKNQARRRVIHIEFSNIVLPNPLNWSETIHSF